MPFICIINIGRFTKKKFRKWNGPGRIAGFEKRHGMHGECYDAPGAGMVNLAFVCRGGTSRQNKLPKTRFLVSPRPDLIPKFGDGLPFVDKPWLLAQECVVGFHSCKFNVSACSKFLSQICKIPKIVECKFPRLLVIYSNNCWKSLIMTLKIWIQSIKIRVIPHVGLKRTSIL